jgi:hypothetical protein
VNKSRKFIGEKIFQREYLLDANGEKIHRGDIVVLVCYEHNLEGGYKWTVVGINQDYKGEYLQGSLRLNLKGKPKDEYFYGNASGNILYRGK